MSWAVLILAGIFEIFMALSLKESHGFTKLLPTILFVFFAIVSFGMLSYSLKALPVGTAYAVWTGIGAAGTALVGMFFLGEPRDALRLGSITLIITGVVGLRLANGVAS